MQSDDKHHLIDPHISSALLERRLAAFRHSFDPKAAEQANAAEPNLGDLLRLAHWWGSRGQHAAKRTMAGVARVRQPASRSGPDHVMRNSW